MLTTRVGVDRVGDVDFQIAVGAGLTGIVFELVSVFVGDADDVEKESVVGAVGSGILDGNGAVNAVPLADESEGDFLADQGGAIGIHGDGVLKVGDAPGFRGGRGGKSEDG